MIARRHSCRAFSDQPLPDDVLDAIVTAGLHAPSANNRQPWRLIVLRDKALIGEIDQAGRAMIEKTDAAAYQRIQSRGGVLLYNTPDMIIVAGEETGSAYADIDCGIVVSHLALAATALGVDSCVAAMPGLAFQGEAGAALAHKVGIPAGFHFTISLLLGYGTGEAKAPHDIDRAKVIMA